MSEAEAAVENGGGDGDLEIPIKKAGFNLSLKMIILIVAVSVGYLLTISLLSGLVFRNINACASQQEGGPEVTTTTTTTRAPSTTTTTPTTPPPQTTTTATTTAPPTTTTTTAPTTTVTTTTATTTTTVTTPVTTTTATTTAPPTTTTTTAPTTTVTTTTATTTTTVTTPVTTTTTTTTPPVTTTTTTTPAPTTTTTTTAAPTTTTTTVTTVTRTFPQDTTPTTTTPAPDPEITNNITLPTVYNGINYNLKISILFDPSDWGTEPNFYGSVDITFDLTQTISELLFHAHAQLNISDIITITNLGNSQITTIQKTQHRPTQNDYHYISLTTPLVAGRYRMTVGFVNNVASLYNNRGIYAVRYLDDLVERVMVSTVFLPNEARKVFPCFDEPQLKATFDISIEHATNGFALSNYPVVSTVVNGNTATTTFATTAPLSTYLVGLAVLPNYYKYAEATTDSGKTLRIYSKNYAVTNGLTDHAMSVALQSINFLENTYLQNSNGLPPKIDILTVADFPYEAVESWGLIMIRETYSLYSPVNDPASTKQRVALEIAQEIAQLWFGGSVTQSSWNELWFNIASASFLKYKIVDSIFPEWELNVQFIIEETIPAMWDDGYASSHPLQVNVQKEGEIISLFDKITFSKGAALMRMVEEVFGEDQVKLGFQNYLNKNANGLGKISDFYSGFTMPSEMSSTTPEAFLLPWILQKNYPVIGVSLLRDTDAQTTTFNFQQNHFYLSLYNQDVINASPYNYTWPVLMKCRAGGTYNQTGDESQNFVGEIIDVTYFLDKQIGDGVVVDGRLFTWIKCNTDFKSYYTTEYSRVVYEALYGIYEIDPTRVFSQADRANVQHVMFQLAYEGTISYAEPTIFSYYLQFHETEYAPWKVFTYHIDIIADLFEHRASFKPLRGFADYFGEMANSELDIFQELTEPKNHTRYLLEQTILEYLCRLQDPYCLYNVTEQYNRIPAEYFNAPSTVQNPLHPNIRESVYKYHLQNTYNYNDWFDLYELYEITADAQEKSSALIGLTGTRLTWLLNYYLSDILEVPLRLQKEDVFTALNTVARNPSGRHLAWYFFRHYFDDLTRLFSLDDFNFGQSIKYVTSTFENKFLVDELFDFAQSHPYHPAALYARQQAYDVASNNVYWLTIKENDIVDNLVPFLQKKKNTEN